MGGSGSVVSGLIPTDVNNANPFPLFVIQAIIIISLCYVLHMGLRKLKQPRVISEVIAGILLGPSVMGRIPGFASTIFNPASLPFLNLISNVGLVFFLFLVGLELDPAMVVKRAKFALGISFAGMVLPLGVGAAVSYVLYKELGETTTVGFGQFLLFCGVAMAITAFPVLARILAEQKLLTTKVGFLTICAGAVGDIVAWILLALVVSIINSSSRITPLYIVLLSIGWILILVFICRPILIFMIRKTKSQDEPTQSMMAFTLALTMISAFVTDIIGVHAIFGSFLVGLMIPNDTGFAEGITKRIEDLVTVIFLPIYFALSGLKTQVGLLDNGRTWGLVILVTFVACFGKIVGCTGAARIQGMEWRESLAIGVLMNCKGLVELIVLNIGYDAGVINARVFVIMVAMCLITTCMTTPLCAWIYPPEYQRAAAARALAKEKLAKGDLEQGSSSDSLNTSKGIMLCLDKIQNLPAMMTFLEMLHYTPPKPQEPHGHDNIVIPGVNAPVDAAEVTGPKLIALRLLHLSERSSSVLIAATERAEVLRRDTLMVVFQAFAKLNSIFVSPRMTLATDPEDFAQSIYDEAVESKSGTIIFPWNSTSLPDPPADHTNDGEVPLLSRPLVASNTQVVNRLLNITARSGLTTAIFVDREFGGAGHFANIMVPLYGSPDDEEALKMASSMSHNRLCNIQIVRIESISGRQAADNQSIDSDSDEEHPEVPEDNYELIQNYFRHRAFAHAEKKSNKKGTTSPNGAGVEVGEGITVHTVSTVQDAIALSKVELCSRDLLILGRGLTRQGRHSSAASTHSPDHAPAQQASNSPAGLHLHQIPTGFSYSAAGTPTHPIDNPLGEPSTTAGGGHRGHRHLRTQPSSRDLHHSNMTVSSVLGIMAHSYLTSGVSSCLLAVQSGARVARTAVGGAGIDFSRAASSIVPGSLRIQHAQEASAFSSTSGTHGQDRPLGFESEHAASPSHSQSHQHIRIVDDDKREG